MTKKTMQNNKNILMYVPYVVLLSNGSMIFLPCLTQFAVKCVFVCYVF